MTKKLSQEEVEQRLVDENLILLDQYQGSRVKHCVQCCCGNVFFSRPSDIFYGKTSSCGCYHKEYLSKQKMKDLTGQRFGRLLVFSRCKNKNINNQVYWHCLCECGCLHVVQSSLLISGNTKSCGCYRADKALNSFF